MNKVLKTILGIIGFAALAVLLWYLRTIIIYILISAILSLIGRPLIRLFDKVKIGSFHIPNAAKAALTLLIITSIFFGFFSIFIPLVAEEARIISSIKMEDVYQNLEEPLSKLEAWAEQYKVKESLENEETPLFEQVSSIIDVSRISNVLSSLFSILGNIFIAIFSILFITFFFLKERELIHKAICALSPDSKLEGIKKVLSNSKAILTRYFIGLLIQITAITTLVSIGLSIIGIENALVIGFFAGLINIIPYIGPLIGASFGILIGISTNLHLDFYTEIVPLTGKMGLVFLTVQMLDNFVFQPFIFSNSVKAHPLEIFLVIMTAATLAGVSGMIIAIPLYSFLRITAKEFLSEFKLVKSLTKNI